MDLCVTWLSPFSNIALCETSDASGQPSCDTQSLRARQHLLNQTKSYFKKISALQYTRIRQCVNVLSRGMHHRSCHTSTFFAPGAGKCIWRLRNTSSIVISCVIFVNLLPKQNIRAIILEDRSSETPKRHQVLPVHNDRRFVRPLRAAAG